MNVGVTKPISQMTDQSQVVLPKPDPKVNRNKSISRDNASSRYLNTEKRVENTTHRGVFLTKLEVLA